MGPLGKSPQNRPQKGGDRRRVPGAKAHRPPCKQQAPFPTRSAPGREGRRGRANPPPQNDRAGDGERRRTVPTQRDVSPPTHPLDRGQNGFQKSRRDKAEGDRSRRLPPTSEKQPAGPLFPSAHQRATARKKQRRMGRLPGAKRCTPRPLFPFPYKKHTVGRTLSDSLPLRQRGHFRLLLFPPSQGEKSRRRPPTGRPSRGLARPFTPPLFPFPDKSAHGRENTVGQSPSAPERALSPPPDSPPFPRQKVAQAAADGQASPARWRDCSPPPSLSLPGQKRTRSGERRRIAFLRAREGAFASSCSSLPKAKSRTGGR